MNLGATGLDVAHQKEWSGLTIRSLRTLVMHRYVMIPELLGKGNEYTTYLEIFVNTSSAT